MVLKQPRCLGSFDSICRQPPPIERKGLFPEGRGIICARGGTLGRTEEGEGSLNLKDTQRGIKAGSRWRWWLWRWWSDWLTAIQPNLTDKITLCLLWIHPETHPTSPPPPNLCLKKCFEKIASAIPTFLLNSTFLKSSCNKIPILGRWVAWRTLRHQSRRKNDLTQSEGF